MASIQGHCDSRFTALREILAGHLDSGAELGASICVSIDSKPVVDIWGGHTSPARDQPWGPDTIVPVWSISKTITVLAVLLLIDRGQLDPNAPVATYWSAFDTDDKRGILVRHILSHTAGLPSWDPPIPVSELFNIPLATEKLLAQSPWWTPGTASGYHLLSQGLLLGELVRRVSGRPLPQFVHEELSIPLNADFHLGIDDEKEWARIAELVPPPPIPAEFFQRAGEDSLVVRAMRGCAIAATDAATPEFRRCGIGSMGGLSNARAVNRILSPITLRGSIDGKRFLKPETIDLIFEQQSLGPDLVLGLPLKMGMGFGLCDEGAPMSVDWIPIGSKACFWGGWGGSIALMDLDRRVTFTYAMNRMENGTVGNSRVGDYVKAVYAVLDGKQATL